MVVRWGHRWVLILMLVLLAVPAVAQNNAFARVSLSPREGVVRQPYKVTISVYSSTWFTAGLQFSNLRVEDAFIIPFTRTVSSIQYINKKKYATLTFHYLVFPYEAGDLEIPEITINASIPPEGGYKGEPVTMVTTPQKIKVNPLPRVKEAELWMVTSGAKIEQQWNKPLNQLKVGDVIERSIIITANGTLPSLIAPLDLLEPSNVSLYPSSPVLKDLRTGEAVNGRRTQTYSYLFETEGEVLIPDEEILWWNPATKRVYKKVLEGQTLSIAPNPDLAMMQSVKDSLEAISAPSIVALEADHTNWKRSVLVAVFILLSFWIVFRMTKRELHRAIERRHAYLNSEAYYYKRVLASAKNGDAKAFISALYTWFDFYRLPNSTASIIDYLSDGDIVFFDSFITPLFKGDVNSLVIDKKKTLLWLKRLRKALSVPQKMSSDNRLNP